MMMRAIELSGRIDEFRRLHLDEGVPIAGPRNVRVIIVVPDDDEDPSDSGSRRAVSANPAFELLGDSREESPPLRMIGR
jgi:hypothetical protein